MSVNEPKSVQWGFKNRFKSTRAATVTSYIIAIFMILAALTDLPLGDEKILKPLLIGWLTIIGGYAIYSAHNDLTVDSDKRLITIQGFTKATSIGFDEIDDTWVVNVTDPNSHKLKGSGYVYLQCKDGRGYKVLRSALNKGENYYGKLIKSLQAGGRDDLVENLSKPF